MNTNVRDNTTELYNSQKRIAQVTKSGTVASGANTASAAEVFTDLTFTSAGSTAYNVEVFIPYLETATNAGAYMEIQLTNGSGTLVAYLGYFGKGNGSQSMIGSGRYTYRYTPAAGTITLNVVAVHITAAGNLGSVTGAPAFLAVYGPDMT
jgi:hypothetical protein